jgi:hypothetical protein
MRAGKKKYYASMGTNGMDDCSKQMVCIMEQADNMANNDCSKQMVCTMEQTDCQYSYCTGIVGARAQIERTKQMMRAHSQEKRAHHNATRMTGQSEGESRAAEVLSFKAMKAEDNLSKLKSSGNRAQFTGIS